MTTKPRIVHLRSWYGGNSTKCGHGGVTFTGAITDDPAKATCKNCLKIQKSIDRDRRAQEIGRRSLHKAD